MHGRVCVCGIEQRSHWSIVNESPIKDDGRRRDAIVGQVCFLVDRVKNLVVTGLSLLVELTGEELITR